MGEVFSASRLGTGQRVAVKIVSRAIVGDLLVQRLHREAVAAGRIRSEFVPTLYDVDRTEDGELFLVMELLHGEPLSDRLRARGGTLTWEEVRAIGDDVLSGLIDAHAAGVVHRDLKPGNIFLEQCATGSTAARERARALGAATTMPRAAPASSLAAHVSPQSEHAPSVVAYSSRASRVGLVVAAVALVGASSALAFALRAGAPAPVAAPDPVPAAAGGN